MSWTSTSTRRKGMETSQLAESTALPVTTPDYQDFHRTLGHATDVLARLRQNLDTLEDMHGRLRYAMGEIRSSVRRS